MSRLSRRHVLLGGLTLAAVAACAEKPILADPAEPVPPINERIEALERRHDARIGVYGDRQRGLRRPEGREFAAADRRVDHLGHAVAGGVGVTSREIPDSSRAVLQYVPVKQKQTNCSGGVVVVSNHSLRGSGGSVATAAEQDRKYSVAVVDIHDAIHTAVELWCAQTQPPIGFAGNYFSAEQFLADHPSAAVTGVGAVVLELAIQRHRVDFGALDRIVQQGHRVIVYSHIATDEVILSSLDRGALTYLAKSERKDHLIDAIRAAGTGTPYVGPTMAGAMLNDSTVGRPNLAPREKEVLIAWFRTESKDLVARQLEIAPTTVRTYLQRVRAKYAAIGRPATTKASLVARAIQDGIVNLDDI